MPVPAFGVLPPVPAMRLFRLLPALLVLSGAASAGDYVLTIGGGYSPSGNQVSLEKNVRFFERVLADDLPGAVRHDVLFADGDDPARDLQFSDPEEESAFVYELLARVLNQTGHVGERYRNHDLPGATASTPQNLRKWFDTVGRKLTAGDRLFVYVTAHGGGSKDRKRPENTRLYLWDNASIPVDEFAAELDKLPAAVPVVMVMVQCHSGGFANLIFDGGDPANGVSDHDRCGFFATVHSRPAAGCTPDIDEEDYREYSSDFWAAVHGRTRTGTPVPPPDFDGDGRVSFAEAHAYVQLHSDTIDIPVKTSDAFLRSVRSGAVKRRPPVIASKDGTPGPRSVTALRPVERLSADSPVESLLAAADPAERAVIAGLSERLDLSGSDRAAAARRKAKEVEEERKRLRAKIGGVDRQATAARKAIEAAVLKRWPELAGVWNAAARRAVEDEASVIVTFIESQPRFAEWERLDTESSALETRRLDLDRDWAKTQRLLRTLESVALAHNLPLSADSETLARFDRLRTAEAATLAR